MRRLVYILFIVTLFSSFDLPKSAYKKMDKTIANLWQDKVIKKIPIELSQQQKNDFQLKDSDLIYQLSNNNKTVAYLYLSQAKSRSDIIDYMIIFNPNISILTVQVLVYREDFGGEVGSKRWLRQFKGKTNGVGMKFGQDIQNISGATISARNMSESVLQVSKKMIKIKSKGVL